MELNIALSLRDKWEEEDFIEQKEWEEKRKRRRKMNEKDVDLEVDTVAACMTNIESLIDITPKKPRSKDVERERGWWENGYRNWNDERFKKVLRVNKDTFDFILSQIRVHIAKQPTNMKPNLIPPETTLALTMYRLAHGCSFTTLEDLFGWSIATCEKEFNHCCRIIVSCLYDRYVRMPANDDEWKEELKEFI